MSEDKGKFQLQSQSAHPSMLDFAAEDVQLMITALRELGVAISPGEHGLAVDNDLSWRENDDPMELFLGNSGTCMRFLTSLVSLRKGDTVLTGKQRLLERPIADLVDALRDLHVDIEYLGKEGYPPLKVTGKSRLQGGGSVLKGDISSQYLSSLLLTASGFEKGLQVQLKGGLISKPYVDMTMKLVNQWGGLCEQRGRTRESFRSPRGSARDVHP